MNVGGAAAGAMAGLVIAAVGYDGLSLIAAAMLMPSVLTQLRRSGLALESRLPA